MLSVCGYLILVYEPSTPAQREALYQLVVDRALERGKLISYCDVPEAQLRVARMKQRSPTQGDEAVRTY